MATAVGQHVVRGNLVSKLRILSTFPHCGKHPNNAVETGAPKKLVHHQNSQWQLQFSTKLVQLQQFTDADALTLFSSVTVLLFSVVQQLLLWRHVDDVYNV